MARKKRYSFHYKDAINNFMSLDNLRDIWLTREEQFSAFVNGPLHDFWQKREEDEFIGVDQIPVRYVRFCAAHHTRVVVIVTGRAESYIKYAEVAYDFFRFGYDVMVLDHRGQGRSGRMLPDTQRGHVVNFDDYVDDLNMFMQLEVNPRGYTSLFALAHSMGGTIVTRFIIRQPEGFNAVALCAPMFGIFLPVPEWLAQWIVNCAENYPKIRDYYVTGTGKWQKWPYVGNVLTHSHERYHYCLNCYVNAPELRLGGPTYHWVRESLQVGKKIIAEADKITTSLLLLQASEDKIVDNHAQIAFCRAMTWMKNNCEENQLMVVQGARHEILFEQDKLRVNALTSILHFFAQHS